MFVFSTASAQTDYTVGVAPAIVDVGEVERGSVNTVKFNVITPSQDPILIQMSSSKGSIDFFGNDEYRHLIDEFSEEDASTWVSFVDNPVELSVEDKPTGVDYGETRGWREVRFLLMVPEDAEPGYHLVSISPMPVTPSESLGPAAARVVSITTVTILFRVEGEAVRDGFILDVVQGDYSGTRMEIDTHFQNTGTVSVTASGDQQVYYKNGTIVQDLDSPKDLVEPGEVTVLTTYLPYGKSEPGEYDVDTEVSFITGSVTKNSDLVISTQAPAPPAAPEAEEEFPIMLVVIVAVLVIAISIVIYKWYK